MKLISFEGIDKSGKTTQAALLAADLRRAGYEALLVREPGATSAGEAIRAILRDPEHALCPEAELFLFLAARAQLVREVIRPALDAGQVVIADRYADSTAAYQGYGRGLDLGWIAQFNERATGGLWPDLTLLVDLDPQAARKRSVPIPLFADPLEGEGLAFGRRVREGYLALARGEPRFRVVDGANKRDDLALEIRALVETVLVPARP